MKITRRHALATGSALAATGLLPNITFAQANQTATLAFGPATPIYALGMVAEEKGYFKDEKLDFKLVTGNAGTHGRQALAAGQALFAHGDASHPLQLSARGKKARIILASQMIASISNIVVRKDLYEAGITTIEKLGNYKRPDGSKPVIAATAIGSGTWMYGTYAMESAGFKDKIQWVAGGGLKTMLPGLETKQFDAIVAVPSWVVEAEANGFGKAIFNTSIPGTFEKQFGGQVPVLVVYTLDDTIQTQKPLVQQFVNGMYRALRLMKTQPLDDTYNLVNEKYFRGQDPAAVKAELGFDKATTEMTGKFDAVTWERGGKVWYRAGTDLQPAKYEDLTDFSFLDAAAAKYK